MIFKNMQMVNWIQFFLKNYEYFFRFTAKFKKKKEKEKLT